MDRHVAGKVVVITGASSGLGAATARLLSDLGAVVVLGARRADRLEALVAELAAQGSEAAAFTTDVTDLAQVQNLVDAAVARYGRVDVLLNNAGIMASAPLERLEIRNWDLMIDVNLKGLLYGVAAALPHMKAQRSGHIINVSSVAGHKVSPGGAVYAATKHGVRAISEGLRQELKAYNIRSTVISPGLVDSELVNGVTDAETAERMQIAYRDALPAESFARVVAFAIAQPGEMDVNEIVFRPISQPN